MKNAKIVSVSALTLLVILGGICWRYTRTESASLTELKWQRNAQPFIVQEHAQHGDYTGPLFIRLRDGKDQFVSGDWRLNIDNGSVFGYGNFAKSTSTADATSTSIFSPSTGPYILRMDGDTIAILELKDIPGTFTDGSISLNKSYIGIRTDNKEKPFCIVETTQNVEHRSCTDLPVDVQDQIMWNPAVEHELVTKSSTGTIAIIDTWDQKPEKKVVLKSENQKKFDTLNRLFSKPSETFETKTLFAGITGIKQNDRWAYFRLSTEAKILPLNDTDHVIVQQGDQLSVLELSTRKMARLFQNPSLKDSELRTRHQEERSL